MKYRILNVGEIIQLGDEIRYGENGWGLVHFTIGNKVLAHEINNFRRLIPEPDYKALAQKLLSEMERYLPILVNTTESPKSWYKYSAGTGIVTLNGYIEAIEEAKKALED